MRNVIKVFPLSFALKFLPLGAKSSDGVEVK